MQIDDLVEPEVGVAVAATAVVLSSRMRNVIHRGAVYGVAGALAAGEAVTSFGRGVTRGWRAPRAQDTLQSGDVSSGMIDERRASTTEDRTP